MSIQSSTYVVSNNLPRPVTTPGLFQSFTDVYGETWVAQGGVKAGRWVRARDCLHGFIFRTAAYNLVVSPGAIVPFDTVSADVYGMYTGSPNYGFQVPVAGWYEVCCSLNASSTVANTYIQGSIYQNNTTAWSSDNSFTAIATGGLTWRSTALMWLAANDFVNAKVFQQNTFALTGGSVGNSLTIQYMGSG